MIVDGLVRTYRVHLPAGYTGETLVPLVLLLHPMTMDAKVMEELSGFSRLADRHGFLAVYPNGVGQTWNDGSTGYCGIDDVGFLNALLDMVAARYAVDPERVFVVGASNGAFMTYRLACAIGDRLAGIATVMGSMPAAVEQGCAPPRPIPLIYFHGSDDFVVPYNGGLPLHPSQTQWFTSATATAQFWAINNGLDPDRYVNVEWPDTRPADGTRIVEWLFTEGNPAAPVDFYTVLGGGHTWPGSTRYQPSLMVGRTSYDMDASERIWAFFERVAHGPAKGSAP